MDLLLVIALCLLWLLWSQKRRPPAKGAQEEQTLSRPMSPQLVPPVVSIHTVPEEQPFMPPAVTKAKKRLSRGQYFVVSHEILSEPVSLRRRKYQ